MATFYSTPFQSADTTITPAVPRPRYNPIAPGDPLDPSLDPVLAPGRTDELESLRNLLDGLSKSGLAGQDSPSMQLTPAEAYDRRDAAELGTVPVTPGLDGAEPTPFQKRQVRWSDNWTPTSGDMVSNRDFLEADVDLSKDKDAKRTDQPVDFANVFGRKFSREDLLKDDEGVRLLNLMEARRTGAYRQDGFWAGLTSFKDSGGSYKKALADIPFFGWIVDGASTVSEAAEMSATMKKLQNGEAVTAHEALAVRRYMLQADMEGQRRTAYNVGSLVHSSIPYMIEMALASKMIAGAAAVGGSIGGPIGAAIGAVGAIAFGGLSAFSKIGKLGAVARVSINPVSKKVASATFKQGVETIARTDANAVFKAAMDMFGQSAANPKGLTMRALVKSANERGEQRALAAIGREMMEKSGAPLAQIGKKTEAELAEYASRMGVDKGLLKERAKFETRKFLAERTAKTFDGKAVDSRLARLLLVDGDTANKFEYGLREAILNKASEAAGRESASIGSRHELMARALKGTDVDAVVKDYIGSFIKSATGGVDKNGITLVRDAIARSLGGASVTPTYAAEVCEKMADRVVKSLRLQFDLTSGNHAKRFLNWVGDGVLDGMMRWDTSIFGAVGTVARDGTVLGGKMNILKEALKASFVEAPVRGVMQVGSQAAMWPVMSMLAGNGPTDFVMKGQLGVQAQALVTGDRDLMEHSWSIALGSNIVEYISENTGRGFNMLASGIAKPAVLGILPDATKELGSHMARKISSVFGTDKLMKENATNLIADSLKKRLSDARIAFLRKGGSAASLPGYTIDDVKAVAAARSLSGNAQVAKFVSAVSGVLGKDFSEKNLIRSALAESLELTDRRAGILFFVSKYMLDKGITPVKLARMFQRVGYDGIISEMAEERYGGFWQGLLGLNERPSTEGFAGRMEAAMEGLFPDRNQLVTEALGFAFPCVTQMAFGAMYSGLGRGLVSDLRSAGRRLQFHHTDSVTVSIGGLRSVDAANIADFASGYRELQNQEYGTSEDNWTKISSGAAGLHSAGLPAGHELSGATSEEHLSTMIGDKARSMIDSSPTMRSLEEKILAANSGTTVFSGDAIAAMKREWRRKDGNSDEVKERLYKPGGSFYDYLNRNLTISAAPGTTMDDVVDAITAQIPALGEDMSMLGAVKDQVGARVQNTFGSDDSGIRTNDFSDDVVGDYADCLRTFAEAGYRYDRNLVRNDGGLKGWLRGGKWFRRGLMRLVGVMDMISTGNIELAATNPVQWAADEAGLDRALMSEMTELKKQSVEVGRRMLVEKALAETPESYSSPEWRALGRTEGAVTDAVRNRIGASIKEDAAEEAGRAWFESKIRDRARLFLSARGVLAVSRSDISSEAAKVVAGRYGVEDPTDSAFLTGKASEIEQTRKDIIKALAAQAVSGAIAVNTNAGYGASGALAATFDYDRAMRLGTHKEIIAAIRNLPAFRNLQAVHNLSGGRLLGVDYGGTLGRIGNASEFMAYPDNPADWTDLQLQKALKALGQPYGDFTPEENVRAAATFVKQVKAAMSYHAPAYVTKAGADVDVTFTRVGPTVTATVYDSGHTVSEVFDAGDYASLARKMSAAGYECEMPDIVVTDPVTFSSSDATSLALFMIGDRYAARSYFETTAGGAEKPTDEKFFPPWLRMNAQKTAFVYNDAEAVEQLRKELAAAADASSSDNAEMKLRMEGDGQEGSPNRFGYEVVARRYLKDRGITATSLNGGASDVLGGGAVYSVRPSGLPIGNTLYITPDYQASGDGEALLRSSLTNAIMHSMIASDGYHLDHAHVMSVYRKMDEAFTEAAERLASDNEHGNPEFAARIRSAVESLSATPGRLDPSRLGTIAAATIFFTSERGLDGTGNGYLLSPEIARVADEARKSRWFPLFMSLVDQACGGTGFFTETGTSANGLARLLDAFSPTSKEIFNARLSAVFTEHGEGAGKQAVTFASMTPGKDGATGGFSVSFSEREISDFQNRERGAYARVVAENCRSLVRAATAAGETLDTERMYQIVSKLDAEAAPAAPATGGAKPHMRMVNGVNVDVLDTKIAPRASDVVSDKTAKFIARSLRFLSSDNTVAAGRAGTFLGRTAAGETKPAIVEFLTSRGLRPNNINRVVAQSFAAFSESDDARTDEVVEAEIRAEASDDAQAAADSGNAGLAQEGKAAAQIVNSAEMAQLSDAFRFVFPGEGANFTAVLQSLYRKMIVARDEVLQMFDGDVKKASSSWVYRVATSFNVLRLPRKGNASYAMSTAESWEDDETTDRLLDQCIRWFHGNGEDTYAFILSAIRNLPRGYRRVQALRQISYMDISSANQVAVTVHIDGTTVFETNEVGSGGQVSMQSVRAVVRNLVLSPTVKRADTPAKLQTLCNGVHNLMNRYGGYRPGSKLVNGAYPMSAWEENGKTNEYFGKREGAGTTADPLWHVSMDDFDQYIARAVMNQDELLADVKRITAPGYAMTGADHDVLVRFANEFAARYSAVADAIDYVFGPRGDDLAAFATDNEICRALRNPDLAKQVLQDLLFYVDTRDQAKRKGDAEGVERAERMISNLIGDFSATGPKLTSATNCIKSQLFSRVVSPILDGLVVTAAQRKGVKAVAPLQFVYSAIKNAGLTQADLLDAAMDSDFEFMYYHSDLQVKLGSKGVDLLTLDRSRFLASPNTYTASSTSTAVNILTRFQRSFPRATEKIAGNTRDGVGETSNVTRAAPCPHPVQDRIVDTLFARLKLPDGRTVKDEFLGNGRRFRDGSTLTVVCAGAKETTDTLTGRSESIMDKDQLSMVVHRANIARFLEGGTSAGNVLFEVYHGEKPTVMSVNLPRYVFDLILTDIASRTAYTGNSVTDEMFKELGTPVEIRVPVEKEAPVADEEDMASRGVGYVNHSGGAYGADSEWDVEGAKWGVKTNGYYFPVAGSGHPVRGNFPLVGADGAMDMVKFREGLEKAAEAAAAIGRPDPRVSNPKMRNQLYVQALLSRNWQQVKNSDAVFAVGRFDDKVRGAVSGGTGYAVQMAVSEKKPVHFYDLASDKWYVREPGAHTWKEENGIPALTKNFAGIGTRGENNELPENGKKAIRDVYERTFTMYRDKDDVKTVPAFSNGIFGTMAEAREVGTVGKFKVSVKFGLTVDGVRNGAKMWKDAKEIQVDPWHLRKAFTEKKWRSPDRSSSIDIDPKSVEELVQFVILHELAHDALGPRPAGVTEAAHEDRMNKWAKDVMAGAVKYPAMADVVRVAKDVVSFKLPIDEADEDGKRDAYDAVFSVLADAGAFKYITTKRTQVIHSQALPYICHHDYATRVAADGSLKTEELFSVGARTKKKIVPGEHFCVSVSGASATQNLGMYFHWGRVVDVQKAAQRNPNAVSQKNHVIARRTGLLIKGQAHCIGLGTGEVGDEMVPTTGVWREAQRMWRRKLERTLELDDSILDPPDRTKAADQTFTDARKAALAAVERFGQHSSLFQIDHETEKCGPLADGCGFAVPKKDGDIHVKVAGAEAWVRLVYDESGAPVKWQGRTGAKDAWADLSYHTYPEYKGGAYSIGLVVPAVMETIGKTDLTDEDICIRGKSGIESDWVDAAGKKTSGTLADSNIFVDLGSPKGDRLSFHRSPEGHYECDFFTRQAEAQVMANSDASSKLTHHSPAATNYDRDTVANGALAGRADNRTAGIVTLSRFMPWLVSKANGKFFSDAIVEGDEEFKALLAAHPNSESVRLQYARKRDALYARLQKTYVYSTHAVLCGSGIKCSFDSNGDGTYKISYDYSDGVTQYDKDTFRAAYVVPEKARKLFKSNRTYSTMRTNVSGDASFRYGLHADARKLAEHPVLRDLLTNNRTYDDKLTKYIDDLNDALEGTYLYDSTAGDIETMARVAVVVDIAEHGSTEEKAAARQVIAQSFIDYTGRYCEDNPAFQASKVSFADLFHKDGSFDFAAVDAGVHKKTVPVDRMTGVTVLSGASDNASAEDLEKDRTVFLGGAFCSGDRRPSGNFEAAGGLCRVQAPVLFHPESGRVGDTALFILDPALGQVQGADTDGDSTTEIAEDGQTTKSDYEDFDFLVQSVAEFCSAYLKKPVDERERDLQADASRLLAELVGHKRLSRFFEKSEGVVQMSPEFNRILGNLLVREQIANYREMPTQVTGPDGAVRDVADAAETEEVQNIEMVGASRVGPSPIKGDGQFPTSGPAAALYEKYTGKKRVVDGVVGPLGWDDAFKDVINAISGKPVPNLMKSFDQILFTAEAGDAGGGRGVMVSIQAAFEHLAAYADSPVVRSLSPALFSEISTGAVPYCGRLDGISNALFDVVKDLFAPRCGWRKDMLNYLHSWLLGRAESEYSEWNNGDPAERPVFGPEWFFCRLVEFAADFHSSETSVAGLLNKYHAGNNYWVEDTIGGRREKPVRTFLAVFLDHANDGLVSLFTGKTLLGGKDEQMILADFASTGTGLAGGAFFKEFNNRITACLKSVEKFAKMYLDYLRGNDKNPLVSMTEGEREKRIHSGMRRVRSVVQAFSDAKGRQGGSADEQLLDDAIDICRTLNGRSESDPGYGLKRDLLTALRGYVLFGGANGVSDRMDYARTMIADCEHFDTLMDFEDILSPDATYQKGGSKVRSLLGKIERSIKRGVDDQDTRALYMQVAQTTMRLTDMAHDVENPLTVAGDILDERVTLGRVMNEFAKASDDSKSATAAAEWAHYLFVHGLTDITATDPEELKWVAAASLMAEGRGTVRRQGDVTVGSLVENLAKLQHVPGAIRLGIDGMSGVDADGNPVDRRVQFIDLCAGERAGLVYVTDVVARLVEELGRTGRIETETGDLPAEVNDLFRLIRVNPATGLIEFTAKLDQFEARKARDGFKALASFDGVVWDVNEETAGALNVEFAKLRSFRRDKFPVGRFTGRELAALMRLEIARTQKFDAADELEVRTNIGMMFGDEIDEMERWGRAASKHIAVRQLMSAPGSMKEYDGIGRYPAGLNLLDSVQEMADSGPRDMYDARTLPERLRYTAEWGDFGMADYSKINGVPVLDDSAYGEIADWTMLDIFAAMVDGDTSLSRSYAETMVADTDYYASETETRPIESPFAQVDATADAVAAEDVFKLLPRTFVNGVKFKAAVGDEETETDSLEDAVNFHIGVLLRDASAEQAAVNDRSDIIRRMAISLEDGREHSIRDIVRKIVEDTLASEHGERFADWLSDADVYGGDSLIDRRALKAVRDVLHEYVGGRPVDHDTAPTGKPRMTAGTRRDRPSSVTYSRMVRGGFFDALREKGKRGDLTKMGSNPVTNIRDVFEAVYGNWESETGVRVQRVTRKNKDGKMMPVDLIRVQRKVKDSTGTKVVTTYISFGDRIPLNVATDEYLASMLESINSPATSSGGRLMTMDELKSMTEAQRIALANSLNIRVLGESLGRKCVTTDALLAVTGLIKLADSADFFTLFHEYFHQTLDFFRDTKVCTDADMKALTDAYHLPDGTFNEEAAADAYAAYLTKKYWPKGWGDDLGERKLSETDYGVLRRAHARGVFEKLYVTARAFLTGALAYDANGVPVFLKMMISADFTDREMQNVEAMSREKMKNFEDGLLNEKFEYPFDEDYESPEATEDLHNTRMHVSVAAIGFRTGENGFDELVKAAQEYIDELAKPGNHVIFDGVTSLYKTSKPITPPPMPTLARRLLDRGTPAVARVQMFMNEALKRFGSGAIGKEYADAIPAVVDATSWSMSEATGADVDQLVKTARRIIRQASDVLGIDVLSLEPDGETFGLTADGRAVMEDKLVAELALRLMQEGTKELQENPDDAKKHASAADVVGGALASVAPELWGEYVRGKTDETVALFNEAAADFRARAQVSRNLRTATGEREADRLEDQADMFERRALVVGRVIDAIARGEDARKYIPSAGSRRGGSLYDYALRYILDGAVRTDLLNGTTKYAASAISSLGLDYDGKFVSAALDSAAGALAMACVVRRYAVENGVELPATGALPSLPADMVVPPPVGVREPGITAQMVLQSPESWLAADLQKNFYGISLRDVMTDTGRQAITEESNRVAQSILFAFGANVPENGYLNKIDYVESKLGMDNGVAAVDRSYSHVVQRVSGVRGMLLGLVTMAPETAGERFTRDDVNMVNMALQAVTGIMFDEPVFTGIDVPLLDAKRVRAILGIGDGHGGIKRGAKILPRTSDYTKEAGSDSGPAPFALSSLQYRLANANRVGEDAIDAGSRPSNLDILLGRLIAAFGEKALGYDEAKGMFDENGLYVKVLKAYVKDIARQVPEVLPDGTTRLRPVNDAEYVKLVRENLAASGLCETSSTGKTVVTVGTDFIKKLWRSSEAYRKLTDPNGGARDPRLLDLDTVADMIAVDTVRLHKAAARSGFLRDHTGAYLTGAARSGLFFEAGTGFHRLIVDTKKSLYDKLGTRKPSTDDKLKLKFASMFEAIKRSGNAVISVEYAKNPDGSFKRDPASRKRIVVRKHTRSEEPAFAMEDGHLVNISTAQMQFFGRLLGKGSRMSAEDIADFVAQVQAGQYTKENTVLRFGFDIRPDMTVAQFDKLIFDVASTLIIQESNGVVTPLTASDETGGFGFDEEQMVDFMEVTRRLGEALMSGENADDVIRGKVCTLSDGQAFRQLGMLPSSRTAPERLMAMAETIVHADRFRGCLAQMLTSVGPDGLPNYVVVPSAGAGEFAPDEYWGAVAKCLGSRLRGRVPGLPAYDPGRSGVENAEAIGNAVKAYVETATKSKKRVEYHMLPPDQIGANGLFSDIFCRDDNPDMDNPDLVNAAVGGEAAGYMKQLFGAVKSPSMWRGWCVVDRLMSYSKAATVGMSAFFAFATRFESPVAACGFLNTVMGYRKMTSEAMRKLAASPVVKKLGFDEHMPFLSDFLNSITSNDPAIRDWRCMLDMAGIPMSSAISNPMSDVQGQIDEDISRITKLLNDNGHNIQASELRGMLTAALHNPSEYAFSNVLNGVKMAVAAQTLLRLRKECEAANRPFDPIRELRRHSAYINSEIGGIQAERYAWLTPGMQRLLRFAMYSHGWTLGAWTAGCGEVVTDALLGGHTSTPAKRQRAFIRWLRMLGCVKVGVPMVTQLLIKGLARVLVKTGVVDDPTGGDDPLGDKYMPWMCFNNESKIGALSIDVTPILKLVGKSDTMRDIRLMRGAWPTITAGLGAAAAPVVGGITGFLTGRTVGGKFNGAIRGAKSSIHAWSTLAGGALGYYAGKLVPAYSDEGRGANTSGRRRYYIHFGKQSDEFWRWFTDAHGQLTSKLSMPVQKVVEAFFGSTNGAGFARKFDDMSLTDRFFTTSLNPDESAIANFFTAFVPFSAASVGAHPDAGVFGILGPVQLGMSQTLVQKSIKARLKKFMEDDSLRGPWATQANRTNIHALCTDIYREARLNGMDARELLQSALNDIATTEYAKLMTAMPRESGDTLDAKKAGEALRALFRVNRTIGNVKESLEKKFKQANLDWSTAKGMRMKALLFDYLRNARANPWVSQPEVDEIVNKFMNPDVDREIRATSMDAKGGENFGNFLATDEVPETLFGVPIVTDVGPEDAAFFKEHPEAGGFYDLGKE